MSAHVPEPLLRRFAEGDVEETVAVEIARHLDGCGLCATRAATLDPLSFAFAAIDDPETPEGLVADVLAAARAPRRVGPEPAIAAGLLALAFAGLLLGGRPMDLLVGAARAAKALGTSARVLVELLAGAAPFFTLLSAVLLGACIWLARTLELQRRSA